MNEHAHPRADELDSLTTRELLGVMQSEDRRAVGAVEASLDVIAEAVDAIAERLRQGGRWHYFGAGTSGRLAALDAAECPATFGVGPELIQAHSAGDGEAEDDAVRGTTMARQARLGAHDAVVGVSASGRTAAVRAALEEARASGALLVAVTCAPGSPLGAQSDVAIEIDAGPEVIAGSSRLKAGTVQKVVLNMLSTGVLTLLGHTYRGRMVDLVATNQKLRARAARTVSELTGRPDMEVQAALVEAGGSAKVAILMLRCNMTAPQARARLAAVHDGLAAALGEKEA
jgi:N-acetylmuramic acid 6-phosphate etherase